MINIFLTSNVFSSYCFYNHNMFYDMFYEHMAMKKYESYFYITYFETMRIVGMNDVFLVQSLISFRSPRRSSCPP